MRFLQESGVDSARTPRRPHRVTPGSRDSSEHSKGDGVELLPANGRANQRGRGVAVNECSSPGPVKDEFSQGIRLKHMGPARVV